MVGRVIQKSSLLYELVEPLLQLLEDGEVLFASGTLNFHCLSTLLTKKSTKSLTWADLVRALFKQSNVTYLCQGIVDGLHRIFGGHGIHFGSVGDVGTPLYQVQK